MKLWETLTTYTCITPEITDPTTIRFYMPVGDLHTEVPDLKINPFATLQGEGSKWRKNKHIFMLQKSEKQSTYSHPSDNTAR